MTIRHPNREKAESKATKAIVVLLLVRTSTRAVEPSRPLVPAAAD